MTRFGCPHVACPGCALIDAPIDAQLATKESRARAAIRAYPELADVRVEPVLRSEPVTRYRTRAKWATTADGKLGLYAGDLHALGDAHEVVDIPGCVVAAPAIMDVAAALRPLLPIASLSAVDLREVRTDGGEKVFVTLVLTDRAALDGALAVARNLMGGSQKVAAVFANLRDPSSPQMLGPTTTLLAGKPTLVDRIGSVKVFATPGSFIQAHRGGADTIEKKLVAFVAGLGIHAPRVLELFAGSGAFGLALAASGARVTSVESFPAAAKAIGDAAALANLTIEVARADADAFLDRVPEAFDVVVVDPPRRGLPPSLREAIAERGPRAIAYVSCDPDTLARDLAHLARLGYRATSVTPIDMIPLTDHVEAIALLVRGEPTVEPTQKRHGDVLVFDAGVTGARIDDAAAVQARADVEATVRCFVTGVTRAKGKVLAWKGGLAFYRRLGVHSGHSEIEIQITGHGSVRLGPILDRLAKFGHAPLGDDRRGTAAAARWAFEALGLDRPFVHVLRLRLTHGDAPPTEVESPLAADLASVRKRLVAST